MIRILLAALLISIAVSCKKGEEQNPMTNLLITSTIANAIEHSNGFSRTDCGFSSADLSEGFYTSNPGASGSTTGTLGIGQSGKIRQNAWYQWGFQEFLMDASGTFTVTSNVLGNLTAVGADLYLWKNKCPLTEEASIASVNGGNGEGGSDEITFEAGPNDTVWVAFLKSGIGSYTANHAYTIGSVNSCSAQTDGNLALGVATGILTMNSGDPTRHYKFVAPSDGTYRFAVDFVDTTSQVDLSLYVNRCPGLNDASFFYPSTGGDFDRNISRKLSAGDVVYFSYSDVTGNNNRFTLRVTQDNTISAVQKMTSGFICPSFNAEAIDINQPKTKNGSCNSANNMCTQYFRFTAPATKQYSIQLNAQVSDSDLSAWIGTCPGINLGKNFKSSENLGNDTITETIQEGKTVTIGVIPQSTNFTYTLTIQE
ncbi:hypothetical protein [Leptospira yasudae]|uniref:Uncharacterized protein n=1 Tax=Leptospira yasudae TaxID=2202201 RepID=A0A6N4QHE0_9LEPT|nr:hypothetical protein [Leptospira yasudae]TGL76864.1 hypothetical protein EHQ77_17860 [Leptospira yasudae]TGL79654.1 hypothetical protein EHQ72_08690 [Leptospira yasudae]TGL83598.1 hypothetical protein EHQ83_12510 [Leptospira yasudae]